MLKLPVSALLQEDHECHLPMLADSSKNGKKVATAHLTMKASNIPPAIVPRLPAGSAAHVACQLGS